MSSGGTVVGLVDGLFRREYARVVAALVRRLGAARLDFAEDCAQEALARALKVWPHAGVPERPDAWLAAVAWRAAVDALRRRAGAERLDTEIVRASDRAVAPEVSNEDDDLRLLLLSCHPALPPQSRVALTLKVAAGFSVPEIARALLLDERAVAQRLVRAKATIRDSGLSFDPSAVELAARLPAALEALYLLFNEGYAGGGEVASRPELCAEAARLVELLAARPPTDTPSTHALAALIHLTAARLPARVGADGVAIPLEEQDRGVWLAPAIALGHAHLAKAMTAEPPTEFHLLAGIAAEHATAPSVETTDWPAIRAYYDRLIRIAPSPVHALNRAVAVAMEQGADAGLVCLDEVAADRTLATYHLLPATRADLLRRAGRLEEARAAYREALALAPGEAARRFLRRRLAAVALR